MSFANRGYVWSKMLSGERLVDLKHKSLENKEAVKIQDTMARGC